MPRLIADVISHSSNARRADAEGAVPFLPTECGHGFPQPATRVRLQLSNRIGETSVRPNFDEHMGMILCSADGMHVQVMIASDPCHVSPRALHAVARD